MAWQNAHRALKAEKKSLYHFLRYEEPRLCVHLGCGLLCLCIQECWLPWLCKMLGLVPDPEAPAGTRIMEMAGGDFTLPRRTFILFN